MEEEETILVKVKVARLLKDKIQLKVISSRSKSVIAEFKVPKKDFSELVVQLKQDSNKK